MSGIEYAELLTAFTDAVVKGTPAEVTETRKAVLESMGFEATVDAAAVIGNFQRMNRIADATGLELDTAARFLSSDFHDTLGISGFTSAENTKPTGFAMKLFSRLIFPLAMKFFKPPMSAKPPEADS